MVPHRRNLKVQYDTLSMTAGSIHDVGTLGHERIGLVQALALSRAFIQVEHLVHCVIMASRGKLSLSVIFDSGQS